MPVKSRKQEAEGVMKKKSGAVTGIFVALLMLVASIPCQAGEGGLVDLLVSQLGVTETQAEGGAGSVFKSAQKSLSTEDFASIAKAVPGIDSMMAAAPEAEESKSSALGSVSSMLGKKGSSIGSMVDLAGSFGKLGMDGDMVGKFVPVILDYVKESGGETVMNLLKKAL